MWAAAADTQSLLDEVVRGCGIDARYKIVQHINDFGNGQLPRRVGGIAAPAQRGAEGRILLCALPRALRALSSL